MDGLFKLIFYIIIGIVWVLSNTKKQALWQEEKSNLPPQPKANPLPKPKMEQPGIEKMVLDPTQPSSFNQFKRLYYDKNLAMKKKNFTEQKKNIAPTQIKTNDPVIDKSEQKKANPSFPAIVANRRQKQSYHLKSSLKEGIIWSIVLGSPRSKQAFNWKASPLTR